jgi:hypothetical protein
MTPEQTDLLSELYSLAWSADAKKSVLAQRKINELCRGHRFLARERARMVKEQQRTQVVLAQRARRGESLVPVRVIKAHGRVREFGHKLPSGHAPREAANARRRGTRRTSAPTRAGPDDPGDPDPDGEHHPLAVRETAGGAL